MQSEERLRRLEQLTDLPLLLLAIVMVPLFLAPYFVDVSPAARDALLAADWLIWSAFAVDFGLKLVFAPARLRYARAHWLEAAMVVLPILRPLRMLRRLRLATLLGLNTQLLREIARARGTQTVVAAVFIILIAGAALTLLAERDAEGANIRTFGDALWWAATTMTTVGYGDRYPTTAAGRGVGAALMLFGIAALSALTASIAAFLVREREAAAENINVVAELAAVREEIASLRAQLQGNQPRELT